VFLNLVGAINLADKFVFSGPKQGGHLVLLGGEVALVVTQVLPVQIDGRPVENAVAAKPDPLLTRERSKRPVEAPTVKDPAGIPGQMGMLLPMGRQVLNQPSI